MNDKVVLDAIKTHVKKQNSTWKFIYGRDAYGKEAFLRKLEENYKFRNFVVEMVVNLSVDILTRKG